MEKEFLESVWNSTVYLNGQPGKYRIDSGAIVAEAVGGVKAEIVFNPRSAELAYRSYEDTARIVEEELRSRDLAERVAGNVRRAGAVVVLQKMLIIDDRWVPRTSELSVYVNREAGVSIELPASLLPQVEEVLLLVRGLLSLWLYQGAFILKQGQRIVSVGEPRKVLSILQEKVAQTLS